MAETTVTLESTLSALIEGKKYATLRDILVTMNPADVAAVFEESLPCRSSFGCCRRSWRRKHSLKCSPSSRSC